MATETFNIKILLQAVTKDAQTKMNQFDNTTKNSTASLAKMAIGIVGVTAVLALLTKQTQKAISTAKQFNSELANVGTLIPNQVKRLDELKGALQGLAVDAGKDLSDLTSGLYQVISAFGDTEDTMTNLKIATTAATAGMASTTDAINLLSAVTKAYGDTTSEAQQKVSDLAFLAVKLGQTTFPELANGIQTVTAQSERMSVSQEELFGVLATLTGVTGDASKVSTQMRSALVALDAPSKALSGLYKEMGIESGKAFIEQQGLAGAMNTVMNYAEATGTPLQSLLGRVEAITFASSLAGAQADTYAEKLEAMGEFAGTTDEAFKQVSEGIDTYGFNLKQLNSEVEVALARLGDKLIPIFSGVIPALSDMIGKLSGNRTESDDLADATDALATSTAEYNDIINITAESLDTYTAEERALLEVRQAQAALKVRKDLVDLANTYDGTLATLVEYNERSRELGITFYNSNKTIESYMKTVGYTRDELIEMADANGILYNSQTSTKSLFIALSAALEESAEGMLLLSEGTLVAADKFGALTGDSGAMLTFSERITAAAGNMTSSFNEQAIVTNDIAELNLATKKTLIELGVAYNKDNSILDGYAQTNVKLYDAVIDSSDSLIAQKSIIGDGVPGTEEAAESIANLTSTWQNFQEVLDDPAKLTLSGLTGIDADLLAITTELNKLNRERASAEQEYIKLRTTENILADQNLTIQQRERANAIAQYIEIRTQAEKVAGANAGISFDLANDLTTLEKLNKSWVLQYNLINNLDTVNKSISADLGNDLTDLGKINKSILIQWNLVNSLDLINSHVSLELGEQYVTLEKLNDGFVAGWNLEHQALATAKDKNTVLTETEQLALVQLNVQKAILGANTAIKQIELQRLVAQAELIVAGVTNQDIVDQTNDFYEDQKQLILDNVEATWEQRLALQAIQASGSEIEQIEFDRAVAIKKATDEYGEQSEILALINTFYDEKKKNYKDEEGWLEKINRKVDDANDIKKLKKFQKELKNLQQTWQQLTPIINLVGDAFKVVEETQRLVTEAEIDRLETAKDDEQIIYDDKLELLENSRDEQLGALQDMYDNDQINFEEYNRRKAEIEDAFTEADKEAKHDRVDATNEYNTAVHTAEVTAFEQRKQAAIADALISGAQGIMAAWALGPIAGIIGSVVIAAATAMQVDSIKSRSAPPAPAVIPYAEGGIINSPQLALMGEANEPEAIIPLSKAKDFGFGGGGNSSGDHYEFSGNTFIGINGMDEAIKLMESRRKILDKRGEL